MTYRVIAWIALIVVLLQAAFYNLYAIPTLDEIIDEYVEHVTYLEGVNDGCYEVKFQLLDELDHLSPELQSERYTMRMRIK